MSKLSYICSMPSFVHPDLKDVSLAVALHALADPIRLAIVARLASGDALNCTATCSSTPIPKSTLSHHFNVLRSAGLIETVADGRERINRLRRAAFDTRFPGLLDTVLANQCELA